MKKQLKILEKKEQNHAYNKWEKLGQNKRIKTKSHHSNLHTIKYNPYFVILNLCNGTTVHDQ